MHQIHVINGLKLVIALRQDYMLIIIQKITKFSSNFHKSMEV